MKWKLTSRCKKNKPEVRKKVSLDLTVTGRGRVGGLRGFPLAEIKLMLLLLIAVEVQLHIEHLSETQLNKW